MPAPTHAAPSRSSDAASLRECLAHYLYEARVGYGVDTEDPKLRALAEAVEYHVSRMQDRGPHEPAFAAAHQEQAYEALERLGAYIVDCCPSDEDAEA